MEPAPEARASSTAVTATDAAASWFARLNSDKVSVQDLQAFQAWRRDTCNDQAYRQVEGLWSRGEKLRGDPEIARALSVALNRPSRKAPLHTVGLGLAAAATLLLAVTFGLWAAKSGAVGARVYQTAVGQQREVHLPDGSAIRLDTDSRLTVRLGPSERRVALLSGRAFFSVAHDVQRPFVVMAGATRVRAVGTRFSVQQRSPGIQVVLVQGVVAVSSTTGQHSPGPSWTLKAGQELSVGGALAAPTPIDIALATSWLQDRLTFRNLPLKDALAEVNRYTSHKLVLDAPDASGTPVSGVFNTSDPRAFATAAADVCGLKVITLADGTILLHSP